MFSSHQLELVERLCDAVAIIKDGRLVATGPVEELRDRGTDRRHVRVAVEADGDGWLAARAGRRRRRHRPARRAGRAARRRDARGACSTPPARPGTVTYFSIERPTLTDLFREAVAA